MCKKIYVLSLIVFLVVYSLSTSALAGTLPDTGQTKCYDDGVSGEIDPCPSPGEPFYGQDGNYDTNTQSYTKLDENGDDLPGTATSWFMVRDNVTGLIWEVKTDNDPPDIHDKDHIYYWPDVQDLFIAPLNSAQFGGFTDWRMPTIKELSFIRNMDTYNPSISTTYFPNTKSNDDWSSTYLTPAFHYLWIVDFYTGRVGIAKYIMTYDRYVRAVRGELFSTNNFINNGDGTITDTSTGLMWELKDSKDKMPNYENPHDADNIYSWKDALSLCENLSLAGYNNWRLPDINELQSIVDYSRYAPAIDPVFSNTVSSYFSSEYWSSTTDTSNPYRAWRVDFYYGHVLSDDKSSGYYVRAVRAVQCGMCEIEIYAGGYPVTPLNTSNMPGRRGLALTCGDTVQFDYCYNCDPEDPAQNNPCPEWSMSVLSGTPPAGTSIDPATGLLTIGPDCTSLAALVELEITVTDPCNCGIGDSVTVMVGEVTLDIGEVTTQPGTQGVLVEVLLDNPDHQVKGIQARIVDNGDYLTCTNCMPDPDNAPEYNCVAQEQGDGDCLVVMTSNNPAAMIEQGSMRPVLSVEFDVAAEAQTNDCIDLWFYTPATLIADKFGCALCPCLVSGEICFAVCGDVYPRECDPEMPNCGDGVVDIFDILEEIDFVLQIVAPSPCQAERADVPIGQPPYCGCEGEEDCLVDGQINIFDALVVIDMALGKANCCDYCADGTIY
jgi:hypothetical protein